MALETATYISDLAAGNPDGDDPKAQGDNHIRLIKQVLQNTFPNADRAFYVPSLAEITTSSTLTASQDNVIVLVDTSVEEADVTVTLPLGSGVEIGWTALIVKSDTDNDYQVLVDGSAADTINGTSSAHYIRRFGDAKTFVWDGSEWKVSDFYQDKVRFIADPTQDVDALPVDQPSLVISSADSGASSVPSSADELVIEGSTDTGISILTPAASTGMINFGDPGSNNQGAYIYDHATDRLRFRAAGATVGEFGALGLYIVEDLSSDSAFGAPTAAGSEDFLIRKTGPSYIAEDGSIPFTIHRSDADTTNRNCLTFSRNGAGVASISASSTTVTYNTSSDIRLKEFMRPIANGLDICEKLKPVKFRWKDSGEEQIGFIAQWVEDVVPWAVTVEEDEDLEDKRSMDYSQVTAILCAGINELAAENKLLKSDLEKLKAIVKNAGLDGR